MDRTTFVKQTMYGKVLDIGCEDGTLHELIYKKSVFGLDLNAKKYTKNVAKGDAHLLPFKNNIFDTIVSGELIEHLNKPEMFLAECKRVLKPGGIIIISTPNKKSWVNRILKSSFHSGHVSLFNLTSIRKTVNRHFTVEKLFCVPYDSVSSWGSRYKKFYWLRKLVHYFLPMSLQENMIILAKNNKL